MPMRATSSGVMNVMGVLEKSKGIAAGMSVTVSPGESTVTSMPCGPHSTLSASPRLRNVGLGGTVVGHQGHPLVPDHAGYEQDPAFGPPGEPLPEDSGHLRGHDHVEGEHLLVPPVVGAQELTGHLHARVGDHQADVQVPGWRCRGPIRRRAS